MAEHIKTIEDREFVGRTDDNRLTPTPLGIGLVNGYDNMGFEISLSKPHMRRNLEADLKRIVRGQISMDVVIEQTAKKYACARAAAGDRCLAWLPPADIRLGDACRSLRNI